MNKTELIEQVSRNTELTQASAERAVNSVLATIKRSLKKGEPVVLLGFGTFSVAKRAARMGRNPRTGEQIRIKAAKVPKFTPGQQLKDATK